MLLSSDYNKLAWAIQKTYNIPIKWAMKSAYCLRYIELDNPERWLSKPVGPLARVWDPANVMKLICVLRSQADLADNSTRRESLSNAASHIYDHYRSLRGIGCEFISDLLDGELVYWATKYYVDSFKAKKNSVTEKSHSIAIDFSEGTSYTTYWFDYFDS